MVQKCPRCQSKRVKLGFKEVSLLSRLAGRNELLCANCGFEFTGFAVIGAVNHNQVWDETDMTNRRRAPRYTIRLPVKVEFLLRQPEIHTTATGQRKTKKEVSNLFAAGSSRQASFKANFLSEILTFETQTVQVGRYGMSLLLPPAHSGDFDKQQKNKQLKLTMELPQGVVMMCVEIVYYESLAYVSSQIMGTRIVLIGGTDSQRYDAFINSLKVTRAACA